jgi:signal peptidase II
MTTSPGPEEKRALIRGKLGFWITVAPLVALDLWSKAAVFAFLAEQKAPGSTTPSVQHDVWELARGEVGAAWLKLSLVAWRNTGTIWGWGQSFTPVLIVLRCLAVLVILYFVRKLPANARWCQVVLGMIMAGAIGNLWDNLTQVKGGVRDFILFKGDLLSPIGGSFPAFNVADSCICIGAFALAVMLWRGDSVAHTSPASDLPSS